MEPTGKTIIYGAFFGICVALFAVFCLGAWLLRKMLPAQHPLRIHLAAAKLLHIAKLIAAALIATYFIGAVVLYG